MRFEYLIHTKCTELHTYILVVESFIIAVFNNQFAKLLKI